MTHISSPRRRLGISYTRWSSPRQGEGDSEQRQEGMFRSFCQRHNLTPVPLAFCDRGRSGYKDEHRRKGRLGQLIAHAKDGRFEPGTVVVVEAWDRLGRLKPNKQIDLIEDLLEAGVEIGVCRLDDVFTLEDFGTHKWTTLAVFVQLAYQESRQKADRVASAWQARRERARATNEQMTAHLPGWLDTGRRPIPDRVALVRRIFGMAAEGMGQARIVHALTAEGLMSFSDRSAQWTRQYVARILNDRRALGELRATKAGRPEGEVLKDYYPAVVTEDEFRLARAGQERRKRQVRRDRRHVNLFQSLLRHARDGEGWHVANHGTSAKPKLVLLTDAGVSGHADRTWCFPYPALETAFLSLLREVDPADVLPRPAEGPSRADQLRARLAAVRIDLGAIKASLRQQFSRHLDEVLRDKEAEEEQVAQDLQEELSRTVRPLERAWQELPSLVGLIEAGGDPARLRLRGVLRDVALEIWLLTVRRGMRLLAALQVFFRGGAVRHYLILYRSAGRYHPGSWLADSLASVIDPAGLDLRRQESARRLEKALAGMDLETLTAALRKQPGSPEGSASV